MKVKVIWDRDNEGWYARFDLPWGGEMDEGLGDVPKDATDTELLRAAKWAVIWNGVELHNDVEMEIIR